MTEEGGDNVISQHYFQFYSDIAAAEDADDDAQAKQNTVVIYNKHTSSGSSYLMLGPWAHWVARERVKTEAALKEWTISEGGTSFTNGGRSPTNLSAPPAAAGNKISVVFLNDALYHGAVISLVKDLGKTVVLFRRETNSSHINMKDKITPATLINFEDDFNAGAVADIGFSNPVAVAALTCVSIASGSGSGSFSLSVAVLSASVRRMYVAQFTDSLHLPLLDCLLTQCSVNEMEIPKNTASGVVENIAGLCKRLGIGLEIRTLSHFRASSVAMIFSGTDMTSGGHSDNCGSKLQQLLFIASDAIILDSMPTCQGPLACILEHASTQTINCYRLMPILPTALLRLDSSAVEALNLVSFRGEARRGSLPVSIFGWLNRCVTTMGSRLMRQWILQPLTSVDAIISRQKVVEAMIESSIVRDALTTQVFRYLSDVDRVVRKIQRQTASLRELCMLRPFVEAISVTVRILGMYQGHNRQHLQDEFILPLEEISQLLDNFTVLLDATIEVTPDREFRIKPDFDDELLQLSKQQAEIRRAIDNEYSTVLQVNRWTEKICKCELHQNFGFVLRAPKKNDKEVRDSKKKFTILNTSKDGIRFVTSHLIDLSERYRDQVQLYEARQDSLRRKLIETVASYIPVLDDAKELIARLDVLCAWASVVLSSPMPMSKPEIRPMEEGTLGVVECWHPLVEMRTPRCIPNSIRLENGQRNATIITGPNMGGKSTFMRSVGVAIVLAQMGCYVPSQKMSVCVHDGIMCRVGATDHMAYGMSTFMVEMIETATIIESATKNTLVIIDELGRGTSTYDGFGLAWAVADYLGYERQARLLFSTHFHELTDIALVENNKDHAKHFFNVHFSALTEGGELQFLYNLEPGPCTKSFGIEVAQQARLPTSLIEDAKARATELENFSGESVMLPPEIQEEIIRIAAKIDKIRSTDETEETKDEKVKKLWEEKMRCNSELLKYF